MFEQDKPVPVILRQTVHTCAGGSLQDIVDQGLPFRHSISELVAFISVVSWLGCATTQQVEHSASDLPLVMDRAIM